MSLILVMTGGALGAGARHLVGRATLGLGGSGPVGTLTVNMLGGLLMGVLVSVLARGVAGEPSRLFLGVGVLGGFTTFSAFSLDVFVLLERGAAIPALGYVFASVAGSIAALACGVLLVRAA